MLNKNICKKCLGDMLGQYLNYESTQEQHQRTYPKWATKFFRWRKSGNSPCHMHSKIDGYYDYYYMDYPLAMTDFEYAMVSEPPKKCPYILEHTVCSSK